MTARTLTTKSVLAAALVLVYLLVASTSGAQTLTASANPPSGAAGLNNSYLTGSGFPAGAVTGATVSFGTSCAGPAVATAPVAQVVAIGTLRRFQFRIPASLAPGAYRAWVSGTAGTTTFNTLNRPSCSAITVTASVQGTASLGAAIGGANVTLTDANGNSITGTTASDGTFALGTAGLTPPFLVRIVTTTPSGAFPAGTTLYSVSADASTSTHVNVNVLTDLLLRSFYSAQGIDPAAAFANPTGINAAPTPGAVLSMANLIIPAVQLWTDNAGIALTGGAPSGGALNLISSSYVAFPPGLTPSAGGLDALLHLITSETVSPDGAVSAVNLAGGTIAESISPVYANDLITLNTTTTDSATGSGTSSTFSALALTATLQPIIDGINATLALFKDTVNTKGAALTASDLLPFYATDYLNDGDDAAQDAATEAHEDQGITFATLELTGIKSVDFTNNVADVIVLFEGCEGGQCGGDTGEVRLKNEGGVWKEYGDQRVGEAFVDVQARVAQGGASLGPGVFSGTFVVAVVNAPHGIVTQATVTGPTDKPLLKIWQGPRGTLAGSSVIFPQLQMIQNGRSFDQFVTLSTNLGSNFSIVAGEVPPGSPFNINLATTIRGNQLYQVQSNAVTTETIHFNNIPAHQALAAVLGQTLTYTFTIPTTYTVGGVTLNAQIADGPGGNLATHSCNIQSKDVALDFATHTGTASLTFPTDMTACDPTLNVPIVSINVFLEANGTNSETSLAHLLIPY